MLIFWLLWAAGSPRVDLQEETPPATGLRLRTTAVWRWRHSGPDGDFFNETTRRQVRRRSHLKINCRWGQERTGFAIAFAVLESARASGRLPGTGRISRSVGRRHEKHRLQIISERGGWVSKMGPSIPRNREKQWPSECLCTYPKPIIPAAEDLNQRR